MDFVRAHYAHRACAVLLTALITGPAWGQEIVWLTDYAAAHKEAAAKNRPLVMDFGTENCFWCKKLDQTTFRDPAVAKKLSEHFIAVRIDADKEAGLAQSLGISSYPTLVFAGPDGKVLGQHAGYVESPKFLQQLDRAMRESQSAVAKNEPAAPKPAANPAPKLALAFPVKLTPPSAAATGSATIDRIRADHAAGKYLSCLEQCKRVVAEERGSPQAVEAKKIADAIHADPTKSRAVHAAILETLGDMYLLHAEIAMRENRLSDAKLLLERTQEVCPASPQALAAKNYGLQMRVRLDPQPVVRMQSP